MGHYHSSFCLPFTFNLLALFPYLTGISRLICLESDNESECGSRGDNEHENGSKGSDIDESEELEWRSRFFDYESHLGLLILYLHLLYICLSDS